MRKNELLDIEFVLNEKKFYEHIRMEQGSKRAAPIERILTAAKSIPRPKVVYGVAEAKIIDDSHFSIDDVVFNSQIGVEKIQKYKYVIPNIVTAGIEIEEYCLSMTSVLDQYILMEMCNFACEYAKEVMEKDLKMEYGITLNECIYPGENGFDMESGKNIFSLFENVREKTGVTLSETGLPSPSRTAYSLCFGE